VLRKGGQIERSFSENVKGYQHRFGIVQAKIPAKRNFVGSFFFLGETLFQSLELHPGIHQNFRIGHHPYDTILSPGEGGMSVEDPLYLAIESLRIP